MKQAKRKNTNRKKLIIAVLIILLLLMMLFANRNRLLKNNLIAQNEYNVTINQTTIDVRGLITAEPNVPVLGAGMIPIKWNEIVGVWEITSVDDNSWYDYSNGKYANIMLSDGKYSSELARDKELATKGYHVSSEDLGTIFTWVPRLMYKESTIEYLKDTNLVEYDWTTPSCFTYATQGMNEFDLAFTGMWVGKETNTTDAITTKNNEMILEDNTYGLIKNEIISTITEEERTVVEKLNQKCGNIQNESTLINLQEGEYCQTIKILNTNMYSPITTQQDISADTIILKTIYKKNDIRCVLDENGNVLNNTTSGNATQQVDEDLEQYVFYVIDVNGNIKKHSLMYEPMGKPNLDGFNINTTFYVTYDENGNEESLIPIGEKRPQGWYDYGNQMWANIVVRNNGDEAYYVWIPRYMYKLNSESQRSDVKFVDRENKYTNLETGKVVSLNNSGYILPEAFTWNGIQLKGFWMSKYQLGATSTYKPEIAGGSGVIRVKNIIANLGTDYTYEMYLIKDGKRMMWDEESGTYVQGTSPITLTGNYTFKSVQPGDYAVSIILRDSTGKQVKAINQIVNVLEPVQPEKPDLTGFDVNTTYYVTYDKNGNETSVVPIGEEPPSNWYNYDNQMWANIVVRNNEQEAYYVWIPRYQYKLDSANERSTAVFIPKEKVVADSGYVIPEAFTWNGTAISGYWMSKYQLGTGTSTLTAAIAGGFDTIRISDVVNYTTKEISTYEAYLIKDGKIVAGPKAINDECEFTGLEYGTYTVQVVGKEKTGNQVLAVTRRVILEQLETPSIVGLRRSR